MADKLPLPWFRMYSEAATDPKFDIIAVQAGLHQLTVFGAWSKILCLAGSSPVRGSLYVTFQKRFSNADVTMMLRITSNECDDLMAAFVEMDMLEMDENGAYRVKNWNKRQFESDNSTERVKKHREKSKDEPGNVSVTPEKRFRNVSVTPPDTETDTDTETETEAEEASSSPDPFTSVQKWMEETTGLPAAGQPSVEAIRQIVAMNATKEDIKNAYDWYRANNSKPMKYYGSLVNSIRTEQAKRVANKTKFSQVEGWVL